MISGRPLKENKMPDMKIKSICNILLLGFFAAILITDEIQAGPRQNVTDTICCPPVNLQVVSTTFPTFCVSWQVNTDSGCIHPPYGYEIQWAYYPGSGPWWSGNVVYSSGTTINFCTNVDTCRNYQWRVRTICDTANGGTYSDWVYGKKFAMGCTHDGQKNSEKKSDDHKPTLITPSFTRQPISSIKEQ